MMVLSGGERGEESGGVGGWGAAGARRRRAAGRLSDTEPHLLSSPHTHF